MSAYLAGLLTIPAVVLAVALMVAAYFGAVGVMARVGITWEFRWTRDTESISDYTLRHNIWWERSFGPIFVGGWYREQPRYMEPDRARINRWLGIGRTKGPNLTVFHSRDLGEVDQ